MTQKWPWTIKGQRHPINMLQHPQVPNLTPFCSTVTRFRVTCHFEQSAPNDSKWHWTLKGHVPNIYIYMIPKLQVTNFTSFCSTFCWDILNFSFLNFHTMLNFIFLKFKCEISKFQEVNYGVYCYTEHSKTFGRKRIKTVGGGAFLYFHSHRFHRNENCNHFFKIKFEISNFYK